MNSLVKYFDLHYFKRFILIFLCLYYFNILIIGTITPGGFYLPFVDQYLNYPSWLMNLILRLSNIITHLLGLNSYVKDDSLCVYNGSTVIIGWPCIGLQIVSFWAAFVIAHHDDPKKRIIWSGVGILLIFLINAVRIALLSLSMEKGWAIRFNIDDHAVFNLIAYSIVGLMIYFYSRFSISRHTL